MALTRGWVLGLLGVGIILAVVLTLNVGGSGGTASSASTTSTMHEAREGPSEIELEQRGELARAIKQQTEEQGLDEAATNRTVVNTSAKAQDLQ